MKQLLQQYAAYNLWANKRISERILLLPPEKQTREIPGSFSSVANTLLHMWQAESMWWQRVKLVEHIVSPLENFNGTVDEAVMKLSRQSMEWEEWVNATTEVGFAHEFLYYNTKKEQFKQPVYQALLHLFNHQTFHRGQLIVQMRSMGEDKMPVTDFIAFCRKRS